MRFTILADEVYILPEESEVLTATMYQLGIESVRVYWADEMPLDESSPLDLRSHPIETFSVH